MLDGVTVRPSGEAAVVLELGDRIDPTLHDRVLALDRHLAADPPEGVVELVPTYRSLLLRVDPTVTTPDDVVAALRRRPAPPVDAGSGGRVHEVAVSFAPEDAEDLEEVAEVAGVAPDDVVDALVGDPLRVYCYGFAPGFVYLGGVPAALDVPRRATPRDAVSPGAVLLAAGQAALCPRPMPTGWWVVGRTRIDLFDASATPPVPFAAGDHLQLVRTR